MKGRLDRTYDLHHSAETCLHAGLDAGSGRMAAVGVPGDGRGAKGGYETEKARAYKS